MLDFVVLNFMICQVFQAGTIKVKLKNKQILLIVAALLDAVSWKSCEEAQLEAQLEHSPPVFK